MSESEPVSSQDPERRRGLPAAVAAPASAAEERVLRALAMAWTPRHRKWLIDLFRLFDELCRNWTPPQSEVQPAPTAAIGGVSAAPFATPAIPLLTPRAVPTAPRPNRDDAPEQERRAA